MKYISTERLPIKMWLEEVEESALEQIKHLANLPFAFKHIAIMPDCHTGYGMPIGGVLATKNVIIPNAVGLDIGCGMCAVATHLNIKDFSQEELKKILGEIRRIIPVGFKHQEVEQDQNLMPNAVHWASLRIVRKEYESALKQIGTLGGGNHFIEIQKDNQGFIWIMIHSGSRNFGLKIAQYYNDLAKELNQKWFSGIPKEWDLAFLPVDSDEGQMYLNEMQYAVDFAFANRKLMMDRIKALFDCKFDDMINIAHNYASLENHFGENVWIHRKGATLAREGTIGIIPGSQGTASYIVEGLGNKESFMSCSHGAGRKMSRNAAMKDLVLEEEQKRLDDQGILHAIRGKKDLDEAAGAYKSIDEVMANQTDLVRILVELKPLAVVKG